MTHFGNPRQEWMTRIPETRRDAGFVSGTGEIARDQATSFTAAVRSSSCAISSSVVRP
jgi:hypothetical protein